MGRGDSQAICTSLTESQWQPSPLTSTSSVPPSLSASLLIHPILDRCRSSPSFPPSFTVRQFKRKNQTVVISVSFSQGSHYQLVCHLSPVFITSVVSEVVVAFDAKQILQSKGERSALDHPRTLSQKDTFARILIKRANLFIKLPSSCDAIHQKFERTRADRAKNTLTLLMLSTCRQREKHKRMLRKLQDRWANIAAVKWFNNIRNMLFSLLQVRWDKLHHSDLCKIIMKLFSAGFA